MLIVRFPKEADKETGNVVCAVFNLEKLKDSVIAFFENSWRGDHYAWFADECISRLDKGEVKPQWQIRREEREKKWEQEGREDEEIPCEQ